MLRCENDRIHVTWALWKFFVIHTLRFTRF